MEGRRQIAKLYIDLVLYLYNLNNVTTNYQT